MTIYMFSGNPGTGKTYHIVKEVILPELQSSNPRHIYHNIRLKPEVIECELLRPTALHGIVHPVTSDWFLKMYDHVDELKGSLIIIDEVQNVFNSSRPMSDLKLMEFFTTHRHHCIDIVLGTQENSNINKVVRSLIEVDNRFYKLKDKTGINAYRVETWYKDDKKLTGSKKRFYDPEFFKFYSSYALGAVSAGLVETPVIPKNHTVRSYLIMAGLAILFLLYAGYKVYFSLSHKSEKFEAAKPASEKSDNGGNSPKSVDVPSPQGSTQKPDSVSMTENESEEIKVPLLSGGYRTITNSFRVSGLVQMGVKWIYTLHVLNSQTEDGINENYRVVQFEKRWEVGDVVDLEPLQVARIQSNPNFLETKKTDSVVLSNDSSTSENKKVDRPSVKTSPLDLYVDPVVAPPVVDDAQSVPLSLPSLPSPLPSASSSSSNSFNTGFNRANGFSGNHSVPTSSLQAHQGSGSSFVFLPPNHY